MQLKYSITNKKKQINELNICPYFNLLFNFFCSNPLTHFYLFIILFFKIFISQNFHKAKIFYYYLKAIQAKVKIKNSNSFFIFILTCILFFEKKRTDYVNEYILKSYEKQQL